MGFEVHPRPGYGPLTIAAGAAGPRAPFTEIAEIDAVSGRNLMYVAVVQVDEADGLSAPPPDLRLAVNSGPLTPVGLGPTAISLDSDGDAVAIATSSSTPDDIHVIEIEVLQPELAWALQIANADSRNHRYTYVVADSSAGTRRPWLDIPSNAITFDVVAGTTAAAKELVIANYGAGALNVADLDDADLGAGFRLLSVVPRPIASNSRAVARVTFKAPSSPGSPAVSHAFAANDPDAGTTLGHNNVVALSATVRPRALWTRGDVLALKEATLGRLDPQSGELIPVTTDVAGSVDVAVDPVTGDAVLLGTGFVKRVDRFTGQQKSLSGFGQVTTAAGLGITPNGEILLYEREFNRVFRVSSTGDVSFVAVLDPVERAQDIAVEPGGAVLVACFTPTPKVVRVETISGEVRVVTSGGELAGSVGGSGPVAVAVAPDGNIIAAVPVSFSPGGGVSVSQGTLVVIEPGNGGQTKFTNPSLLAYPTGLAVAADGTILVAGSRGVFAVDRQTAELTNLSQEVVGRIAVVPPSSPI